jgi:maltose-binding protein MalE
VRPAITFFIMKTWLLSLALLALAACATGQLPTISLRTDTVKIWKNGGYAELLLQNSTKDTLGIAVNAGNGHTVFMRPRKLNDSTLTIGLDTFTIGGNTSGLPDTVNYVATYYRLYKVADSIVALAQLTGDDWGDQTIVVNEYLTGHGVDGDTLSINLDSFYTKTQVDSIAAALSLAGGADNWGTQELVPDNYTIKGGGVTGDSARVDTGDV